MLKGATCSTFHIFLRQFSRLFGIIFDCFLMFSGKVFSGSGFSRFDFVVCFPAKRMQSTFSSKKYFPVDVFLDLFFVSFYFSNLQWFSTHHMFFTSVEVLTPLGS